MSFLLLLSSSLSALFAGIIISKILITASYHLPVVAGLGESSFRLEVKTHWLCDSGWSKLLNLAEVPFFFVLVIVNCFSA